MSLRTSWSLAARVMAAALVVAAARPAQAQEFTFAGIDWNSKAADVRQQLQDKGYEFVQVDKDGDYEFKGRLLGQQAQLLALMSEGRLQKMVVFLATPDEEARSTYADLRRTLVEKYGKPTETIESYDQPYRKGDGREDEAIKAGKGQMHTYWIHEGKPGDDYLGLSVTDNLGVQVTYESRQWTTEVERRRQKQKQDF